MHRIRTCLPDLLGAKACEFLESQLCGDANILHEFGIRFIVALLVRLIVGRGAGDLEHVLDDVRQRLRCKLRAECFWMRTRYETVQESFAPVGEPVRALCCRTIILRQDGYEFRLPLRQAAPRYVEQGLQRLR